MSSHLDQPPGEISIVPIFKAFSVLSDNTIVIFTTLHVTSRPLRIIVATSLGLPDTPPADPLLDRAVCEVATRLCDDPISVANSRLFASQCECYYTPVFDISLNRFQQLVSDSL